MMRDKLEEASLSFNILNHLSRSCVARKETTHVSIYFCVYFLNWSPIKSLKGQEMEWEEAKYSTS